MGMPLRWHVVREEGGTGFKMTNVPDPGESPDNPPKPVKPPKHKRGAFPTPKSEIDKARAYIPDVSDEEGGPEGNPDRPSEIEGEEEG